MKHFVLFQNNAEYEEAHSNDKIFTIKGAQLDIPVVTFSAKDKQKILKLLSKGFERSVYWSQYKTKNEDKSSANEYRYFVGVSTLSLLVYSNTDNVIRSTAQTYFLPKIVIKNSYPLILV